MCFKDIRGRGVSDVAWRKYEIWVLSVPIILPKEKTNVRLRSEVTEDDKKQKCRRHKSKLRRLDKQIRDDVYLLHRELV